MCRFASFFHNPFSGEIAISDLESHGNTENKLQLNKNLWREGHYLPTGELELRLNPDDKFDKIEVRNSFLGKYPTFISFLNWALKQLSSGYLDLSGLTSAKDLVLPKTMSGSLDLSGLTSAKDLVLPKTVNGYLDLNEEVRTELKNRNNK